MWPFNTRAKQEQQARWAKWSNDNAALRAALSGNNHPQTLTLPANIDTVYDALKCNPDLTYIREAMVKFPGRRGFIHLQNLTNAINERKFRCPPPTPQHTPTGITRR